jgi:hypothetical protein
MKSMDAIIELISNLNAKAKDKGTTEEEAANFAAKVQELLAKHNLDESVLLTKEEKKARAPVGHEDVSTPYQNKWRKHLANSVGEMYFCRYVFVKYDDKTFAQRFVGKAHNRVVAVGMFQYLEATVVRLSKEYGRKLPKSYTLSEKNEYRYEFEKGCGMQLACRIRLEINAAKEGKKANVGNLPALYSTELAIVDEQREDDGRTQTKNTKTKLKGEAAYAGILAANDITWNSQINGSANFAIALLEAPK